MKIDASELPPHVTRERKQELSNAWAHIQTDLHEELDEAFRCLKRLRSAIQLSASIMRPLPEDHLGRPVGLEDMRQAEVLTWQIAELLAQNTGGGAQ